MTLATVTNQAVISLDGVELGGIGADDVQVEWNNIEGWHDAAPKRTGFTDRDNADGSYDAAVYLGSRVVTVQGWAIGPSRRAVAASLHRMTGMLAGGRSGRFRVNDPDYGDLSAVGRISDGPKLNWNESKVRYVWQFSVTCPDPLKYGPQRGLTTGMPTAAGGMRFPLFAPSGVLDFGVPGNDARLALTNDGTADTWPTYVAAGPIPGGFSITEVQTGRFIRFADTVPAGSVATIRAATGRADVNGADRSGSLTVAQWFHVPAMGSTAVQFTAPAATGQSGSFTALVQDAYE